MSEVEQDLTTAATAAPSPPPPAKEEPTKPKMSFTIWPPADRTREAVVKRLIETLSAPSVLSKRYGTLPEDEASAAASRIEEEAFSTAAASTAADDDGIQILQLYSKEISKRMLETVKSKSAAASPAADDSKVDASSS